MGTKINWETTKAKDLQVGDIVRLDRFFEKHKTGVVSSVEIVPKEQRHENKYQKDYYKKKAMRRVLVTLPNGSTTPIGWDHNNEKGKDFQMEPDAWIERQCSQASADSQQLTDEIVGYRIGVRTVLSRCETDLVQWKTRAQYRKPSKQLKTLLESYREEYTKIFEQLEALDARMTKDAGKEDVRKPVHPHGRRRN